MASPVIPAILSEKESSETTSFLNTANENHTKVDTAYGDFFQESSDGKISGGNKAQKSGLETIVSILSYIVPIVVVISIIAGVHVFLRNQESGTMFENYPFLCSHLNYGVDLDASERGCKTLTAITKEYDQKRVALEDNILRELNTYIPLKVTQNIIRTSPEKKFIIDTYNNKLHADDLMSKFDLIRKTSESSGFDNITCTGISITGDGKISTQCTVYGADIGANDDTGALGSARIEALRFLDNLSGTNTSGFILLNPPTSLSIEKTDATTPTFQTRTTVAIQAQYVDFTQKP